MTGALSTVALPKALLTNSSAHRSVLHTASISFQLSGETVSRSLDAGSGRSFSANSWNRRSDETSRLVDASNSYDRWMRAREDFNGSNGGLPIGAHRNLQAGAQSNPQPSAPTNSVADDRADVGPFSEKSTLSTFTGGRPARRHVCGLRECRGRAVLYVDFRAPCPRGPPFERQPQRSKSVAAPSIKIQFGELHGFQREPAPEELREKRHRAADC
ncbi:UNVERIFIED_ORG: hypothetical protein GGD59_003177 [Rhizobium esperanzae]